MEACRGGGHEKNREGRKKTNETKVIVSLAVDGDGTHIISTGIPFFDHMLHLFSKHGLFDLQIEAQGDIDVDYHHTVEDVGIAMGRVLREALAGFEGIERYGHAITPMDEALCVFVVDMSGRPNLVWRGEAEGKIGVFDAEVVREFFKGFVNEAGCTIHVNILYGENLHHKIEAVFKAFGKALRQAVTENERIKGVLSTKGVL
ncbi:imidazoleglycerol-phosphate dehydratase HisB [Syntrophorhabdus aromaticivorans]|uniref:imidazoleglycerol-phosphate dehydratase HisB n=1 Tax=Syntrophorhabdus aromaticivorans TaxID=328301 RepID=UPI00048B3525|nr:imidazoleglycerol-phosphate dehydratase HisB [Syntrophorhabdus aromaticivorans]